MRGCGGFLRKLDPVLLRIGLAAVERHHVADEADLDATRSLGDLFGHPGEVPP
jgi:hypothetical protein